MLLIAPIKPGQFARLIVSTRQINSARGPIELLIIFDVLDGERNNADTAFRNFGTGLYRDPFRWFTLQRLYRLYFAPSSTNFMRQCRSQTDATCRWQSDCGRDSTEYVCCEIIQMKSIHTISTLDPQVRVWWLVEALTMFSLSSVVCLIFKLFKFFLTIANFSPTSKPTNWWIWIIPSQHCVPPYTRLIMHCWAHQIFGQNSGLKLYVRVYKDHIN